MELYAQGAVAATMAGPPCETFSSARHQPAPTDAQHWPRPLRSAATLWGLLGLTHKELKQCQKGSEFALQTLWALACHLVYGGAFLGEHPGLPPDKEKASIWRTGLVQLFRKHPDCKLWHVNQWEWGCSNVKPTGLLSVRLPSLYKSMALHKQPGAVRPTVGAIGKQANGEFATSHLKEYPELFGKGLARVIHDRFLEALRTKQTCEVSVPSSPELYSWLRDTIQMSLQESRTTRYLPDFQG